ncbi:MAG: hypothetical protein WCG99_03255 [Candidatus Berkelbacteria bacterium]
MIELQKKVQKTETRLVFADADIHKSIGGHCYLIGNLDDLKLVFKHTRTGAPAPDGISELEIWDRLDDLATEALAEIGVPQIEGLTVVNFASVVKETAFVCLENEKEALRKAIG